MLRNWWERTDDRGRAIGVFLVAWALLFGLGCCWALASPVASGPDESGHLIKAAASVRGEWSGQSVSQGIESFSLPGNVGGADQLTCFAGRPDTPASCAPPLASLGGSEIEVRTGVGSYNPLYYLLVGWPSLFLSGGEMVYAMRALNALLMSFFLAVLPSAVLLLPAGRRPWAFGAIAVAVTPMLMYLGGIVNPSGPEVAAVVAFAVLSWRVTAAHTSPAGARTAVVLALSVAVAANLRATTPLYLLLVLIPLLIAADWPATGAFLRRRSTLIAAGVAAIAAIAGLVWSLLVGLGAGYIPSAGSERDGVLVAFVTMLRNVPAYGREMIGIFGWLDTQLLEIAYVVWVLLIGFVLILALALLRGRALAAAIVSTTVVVLTPAFIQAPATAEYGYIWQGRYGLPLLAASVMTIALLAADAPGMPGAAGLRRANLLVWATWWIVMQGAFFAGLRRYMTGTQAGLGTVFSDPSWTPPLGWIVLLAAFALLSAALVAFVVLFARASQRGPDALGEPGENR